MMVEPNGSTAGAITAPLLPADAFEGQRRNLVTRATIVLAALAVVAMFLQPTAGFAAAAVVLVLASIDWRLTSPVMIASFAALVIFIPGDLRMVGGFPIDISADRAALAVMLGAFVSGLVALPRERLDEASRRPGSALIGLWVVAAISLAVNLVRSSGGGGGMKGLLSLGFYLALYFIVVAVVSRDDVVSVCKVVVTASGIVGLTAMIERLAVLNPIRQLVGMLPGTELADLGELTRGEGIRVAGTAEHPIAFGGLMAMVLPLAIYFMFTEKKNRGWWVVATAFIGGSMVLSVSRSALLAAAVGCLTLFVVWPKHRMALASFALIGLLGVHLVFPGVLGAFRATFSPEYLQRQESLDNPYNRVSDYPRVKAIIPNQPVFGLGYNSFDPETYFYLDNQMLKMILEVGFVGLFFLLLFLWRVSKGLVRVVRAGPESDRGVAAALLGSVLSFTLLSVLFDTFGFSQVTWMFFLISALAVRFASGIKLPPQPNMAEVGA